MKRAFIEYINNENLCKISDTILLTVSGGIDSMVMLNLFLHSNFKNIAVAHCNFSLRGSESDEDQRFIETFCKEKNITCFVKKFDTLEYSKNQNISTQMAARDLRYNWFRDLMHTEGFDRIAIAHNMNDSVETFIINLSRGTGIKGLTGISQYDMERKIIRPLLFATREEITKYALSKEIPYREDSSNKSVKYHRNFIRHKIIPKIKEISPGFIQNVTNTIANLTEVETIYHTHINELIQKHTKQTDDQIIIYPESIIHLSYIKTIFHEILFPLGFHPNQLPKIIAAYSNQPGKHFKSEEYELVIDRDHIVIQPRQTLGENEYTISDLNISEINKPIKLKFSLMKNDESMQLKAPTNIAFINTDRINLPLKIRSWRKGDYFYPLGMKGKKKLSDFFKDLKLNKFEKDKVWLLCNKHSEEIVWVIGHRLDERFKVEGNSNNIIQVEYIK